LLLFLVDGEVSFGSKAGITDLSQRIEKGFLPHCGIDYHTFCESWLKQDFTPMFEWCSNENQIVINYPKSALVLIAIRNNITGEYILYDDMVNHASNFKIPVAKALSRGFGNAYDLVKYVKGVEGEEGFVIRFNDGTMYKIKSDWYFERHRSQADVFRDPGFWDELSLWNIVLDNNLDDILSRLEPGRKPDMAKQFQINLWQDLDKVSKDIYKFVQESRESKMSKKDFVLMVSSKQDMIHPSAKPIYFKLFDLPDLSESVCLETLVSFLKKTLNKQTNLPIGQTFAPNAKFYL